MSVLAVFYNSSLLFVMMMLGYGLSRAGYLTRAHTDFITRILFDLFIPCIVLSAAGHGLGGSKPSLAFGAALLFFGVMLLFLLIGKLVGKLLGLNEDQVLVMSRSAGYPNNGFMGLPLSTAIFGAQGTIWCAFTMMGANVYLFSCVLQSFIPKAQREKARREGNVFSQLITPLNVSTILMLIILLADIRLPSFAQDFFDAFGNCTTPLAMLVAGNLLSYQPLMETLKNRTLYLITLLRNVTAPLFMAILCRFLGLETQLSLCLSLLMGCSVASAITLAANRYDREAGYASQALLQSSVLLPITLPLVMAVANRLLA